MAAGFLSLFLLGLIIIISTVIYIIRSIISYKKNKELSCLRVSFSIVLIIASMALAPMTFGFIYECARLAAINSENPHQYEQEIEKAVENAHYFIELSEYELSVFEGDKVKGIYPEGECQEARDAIFFDLCNTAYVTPHNGGMVIFQDCIDKIAGLYEGRIIVLEIIYFVDENRVYNDYTKIGDHLYIHTRETGARDYAYTTVPQTAPPTEQTE